MLKKPNIVFVLSDQQRWDTVGVYDNVDNSITPNLDKLAGEGVLFENTFTCQPVCGPARSCLQTGKYATRTGCYRNDIALPQDEKTIAHWFTEAAYQVAYIGKWHLASTGGESSDNIGLEIDNQSRPVPLEYRGGWKDYWLAADVLEFTSHPFEGHFFDSNMNSVEFGGYRVDKQTDFAIDYIKDYQEDEPFFLFLSYLEPHHQNDMRRYVGPVGSKESFKDYNIPPDLRSSEGDWQENYPDYLGSCHSLDYNLGRIVDELKIKGIYKDTIIIYTSDHGSHFKTRNSEYKRSCHENSIRIPLVISGPGFSGGKVVRDLVSIIDLPPTLIEIAGLESPNYMDGRPLQSLLDENCEIDWREEVFIQISESHVGRAIRTNKWKYSVRAVEKDGYIDSSSDIYVEDFLYNLEEDPYEKENLVDKPDYRKIRSKLRERLKHRMVEAGEASPKIVNT